MIIPMRDSVAIIKYVELERIILGAFHINAMKSKQPGETFMQTGELDSRNWEPTGFQSCA